MSILDRKKPAALTAIDIERVAQAVAATLAGHSPQHHGEPSPPAATESRRARAIMRSVAQSMPAAERLSGPAPGPAAPTAQVAPISAPASMPATRRPLPPGMVACLTSLPLNIVRDLNGRLSRFSVGDLTVSITGRDAAGRVTDYECPWYRSKITRNADGSTTTTTIPTVG